jgi:hypothetical protein
MHQNEDEQSQTQRHGGKASSSWPDQPNLSKITSQVSFTFQCVHKSLFSLISDPHFANSHFQITATKHTHRIMCMSYSIEKTLSFDFELKLHFESASQIPSPNFELSRADFLNKIISSCRSFIFLHHSSKFHLWNPRAHKQIHLSLDELNVQRLYIFTQLLILQIKF